MAIKCLEDLPRLGCGYHIRDHNFSEIVYADSEMQKGHIEKPRKGSNYIVEWKFRVTLRHGHYNLATVLSIPIDMASGQVEFCDFVPVATQFEMTRGETPMIYAPVYWENQLNIQRV
jgi:lipopolysaccharide transport system ATP-binding protein